LGRITVPPNVFARDIAQPSVALEPHPSNCTEPSGAPSKPAGAEPMDEDPSNEAYVLSLLEGYDASEAEAMDVEPAPAGRTGATNTSPGWTEGNSPRTGPRPGASPGWPNPSPSSTASCTRAPPPASCSVRAHPRGARAPPGHTRRYLRPPCRAPHPRRQRVPPGLLLAHHGR
jgi:hypothetical protein